MTAPAFSQGAADGTAAPTSWIPALLACAAAIVCWSVGEDWRQEMTVLTQQLNSAASAAGRGNANQVTTMRRQAASAQSQREATEARLRTHDNIELIVASLTADLRRMCLDSTASNCVVRLAEDSLNRRPTEAGAAKDGQVTLESLNVQRARATVSGSFLSDEPTQLARAIMSDASRAWRINGMAVRANNFEIDVERLVIAPSPSGLRR